MTVTEIDFQIIPKSLTKAVEDTMQSMANENASLESVSFEVAAPEPGTGIISILGVKGARLQGSIALYFPEKTYVPLMNKVLGESHGTICAENADGASEFLNIIYAAARVTMNENGFQFEPAIPATLKGQSLELPKGPNAKTLQIRYKCELGYFLLMVALTKK